MKPYRRGETMTALFADAAARVPDGTAIVHGDRRVSYAELDAVSDHYAAALEDAGVGPGHFVPVLLPRTPEFLAVLLAILKRGAAYAAFDQRWPMERMVQLVHRLAAPLIVTADAGPWQVPTWTPPPDDFAKIVVDPHRPSTVEVRPDDPCAVYFTSGSTGEPKGVVSLHRGTARLFDDCEFADFGPGIAMPQLAPVPWDGFTLDCWGVLLNGGTSVFVDDLLIPRTLRQLVARDGVNALFLTTSLFNMMVDDDLGAFDGMRWVVIGGERVSGVHIGRFVARYPDVALHNLYGPAECSVLATAHRVTAEDCADPLGVPIGRPLNRTDVYLLDGDRPCGIGEPGEICLGGDGVAAGYVNDPARTAEAFVDVVVDGRPRRVYRTGDLGQRRADGALYYRGRLDRQVKILGHRIEPAEIEQRIARFDDVAGCVVVPVPGPDGSYVGLALFYVDRGGLAPEDLRFRLSELLPHYLVPGHICRVDALPLLASGKIDTRQLVALASTVDSDPAVVDDSTQGRIAVLIARILGRPSVPVDVSLFHLGGTSLDAARLCGQFETEFGVAITPSQVFRTPSAAGLAEWYDGIGERSGGGGRGAVAAWQSLLEQPWPGPGPAPATRVPLLPHQYMWAGNTGGTDSAVLCPLLWWIDGPVDLDALALALGDVHRRHQALHAAYAGAVAGVPDDPGEPAILGLPSAPSEEAARAAVLDALLRPLALDRGEVWRAVWARVTGTGRVALGIVLHHIAFDGWSQALLAADLSTAYAARAAGSAPVFATPSASLTEIAAEYFRGYRQSELATSRAYWAEALRDLPACRLPGWRPSDADSGPVYHARAVLPLSRLADWYAFAQRAGTTRFAALAAAYGIAVHRLTGQPDFGVLVPVARRGTGVMDPTIMCRVDVVCLRMSGLDKGLLDGAVRAVDRGLAAQDVPFAEVAQIPSAEALQSSPWFALQDDPDPALVLPGCRTAFDPIELPTASADLYFTLHRLDDTQLSIVADVRTDRVPPAVADELVATFIQVIEQGPAALA
jgi:mycobactin peptide synthetase MbtE